MRTIREFLYQGATPHELALAISMGVVIGMFPVQGTTTLICMFVAVLFRLNLVVIQLANYISFPLMMVMIIPFYSMGNLLFNKGGKLWNADELILLFRNDLLAAVTELSWSIGFAVVVWLMFAPAGLLIIYLISLKILKGFRIQTTS
jgi:uncharacterized protein (DUF2062 family)